jgi:hypothetical protein
MTELDNYKEDINKYQNLWDDAVQKNSNFKGSNFKSEESVKIGLWGQALESHDDFWEQRNVVSESVEPQSTISSKLVTFNQFLNSKEKS